MHQVFDNLNPTTEIGVNIKMKDTSSDIKESDYDLIRIKNTSFERQYTHKLKNTIYQKTD